MRKVTIKAPIWKTRSIGIAEYKITDDLEIKIDYKDKQGDKLWPHRYFMDKNRALCYPKQVIRGGIVLRIIPIDDLRILQGA